VIHCAHTWKTQLVLQRHNPLPPSDLVESSKEPANVPIINDQSVKLKRVFPVWLALILGLPEMIIHQQRLTGQVSYQFCLDPGEFDLFLLAVAHTN
jgi:hypothetical protein